MSRRPGSVWGGHFLATRRVRLALPTALITWLLLPVSAASAQTADPLTWKSADGEQSLKLDLESRFRLEGWDAHARNTDWFHAFRTRARVRYSWQERLTAFAELQDARIHRLDSDSSGAGSLYRTHSGGSSHAHADRIRQLWVELEPASGLKLRLGRQDLKLGTEVMYPEPNWRYLKVARGSQRLVGTVGWTHGERSNDGVSFSYDLGDWVAYGFGAKPTTGVFDIDSSYSSQNDILYGGLSLTAKRGTLLPNTEVRLFGIGYEDDRDPADGGRSQRRDVDVYTLGFSAIGVHPAGAGSFDLLVWGAYQWGAFASPAAAPPYGSQSHSAWAALLEAGYQLPDAAGKPWFRVGLNVGSGDDSATDSDQNAFFNLLPTNHLYYGFADRFALGNLIDTFAQLKLAPAPKTDLNVFLHRYQLFTDDDGRYFGTGAFNRSAFGIGLDTSGCTTGPAGELRCHRGLGTELDVVLGYSLHPRVNLQAGYAHIWGHGFFNGLADDDVRFAYLQVAVKYP